MNKATNSSSVVVVPAPGTAGAGTNDIRDIRDPVPIPSAWTWIVWTLGALAVALVAWKVWQKWRRKRAQPKPVRVVPPHEKAREQLREALALIGQPRPFVITVSDITRLYLEERFSFRAPERTTEEFLLEMQTSQRLTYDQKQTLADFLSRCDLVKFARYEPTRPELEALHNAAVRLVEETEPVPINAGSRPTPPLRVPTDSGGRE